MKLSYLTFLVLVACGSSSTDNTTVDASSDHASGGDGSSQDDGSTSQDGSTADSSNGGDSGTESGTDQLPCDPSNPATCAAGHKCCSEPTHKTPPTIYECVPPQANGSCPMYP